MTKWKNIYIAQHNSVYTGPSLWVCIYSYHPEEKSYFHVLYKCKIDWYILLIILIYYILLYNNIYSRHKVTHNITWTIQKLSRQQMHNEQIMYDLPIVDFHTCGKPSSRRILCKNTTYKLVKCGAALWKMQGEPRAWSTPWPLS